MFRYRLEDCWNSQMNWVVMSCEMLHNQCLNRIKVFAEKTDHIASKKIDKEFIQLSYTHT